MEAKLNQQFIKTHRSFIVNKNRIEHFAEGKVQLGPKTIPISKGNKANRARGSRANRGSNRAVSSRAVAAGNPGSPAKVVEISPKAMTAILARMPQSRMPSAAVSAT